MPNLFGTNYGAGSQNIAMGSGDQNNNIGSGPMFVGNYFYGELLQNPEAAKAKRLEEEKEACLRSLGFQHMDDRYQMVDDVCPDTCDWIFHTVEFQEWWRRTNMETHNGVLWIKGNPGVGKSTLMKHILQWCEINPPSIGTHMIIRYFFNARGTIDERSPLGMLRSIIYQLVDGDGDMYEKFVPIFRHHKIYDRGVWRMPPLKGFILSIIKQKRDRPMLLLVDALDECSQDEARGLIGFLENLSDSAVRSEFQLRICLSSRHYPAITIRKKIELVVEHQAQHHNDISQYINEKLYFQDTSIHEQLMWKAGGIFLWVVIVIQILNRKYVEGYLEEMENALQEVPAGLEEIFTKLLTDDGIVQPETLLMLQWMLFSGESVTPEVLFYATRAGISHSYSRLTEDDIKRRINTVSKGLIEIQRADYGQVFGHTDSVNFIHLSVRDFLSRNQRLQSLDPTLGPDPVRLSHRRLWRICWSCIREFHTRYPGFGDRYDTVDRIDIDDIDLEFPFVRYARRYVLWHAERGISEDSKVLQWGTGQGCMSGEEAIDEDDLERWLKNHNNWCRVWNNAPKHDGPPDIYEGIVHALSLAACPRLLRAILVEEGVDPNEQSGQYGNGLQAAAQLEGSQGVEVVQLLLDAGADVNAQGGVHGNALGAASLSNNAEIVKMLVEAGADVNGHIIGFRSALQNVADHRENAEVLKLLLQAGADVNARGGTTRTALQSACVHGDEEMVKVLLKAGADVNAKGGDQGNALKCASFWGNDKTVQLLLEAGADVNAQGGKNGTALQAACAGLRPDNDGVIMRLLLKAGADVNIQGGNYGSALIAAASGRMIQTVQLLLQEGADVNAQDEKYGSALQAACARARLGSGHDDDAESTVRLLLMAGADVNAQGGEFGSALQAAVFRGRIGAIQLLLEAGADVNAQGGKYGSALQAACASCKHPDTVRLLLKAGAEVNAQGGRYGSALLAAIERQTGEPSIIQLLLQEGADANAKAGESGNPLQAACARPYIHEDVIRLLVSAGADVNAEGGKFGSALKAAKARRRSPADPDFAFVPPDGIIDFLLQEGAVDEGPER